MKDGKIKETHVRDFLIQLVEHVCVICDRFDQCVFTFTHFERNWTPKSLIGPVCTTI